ncbi:putative chitinase [Lupinus albus]|uniref:Acidic endochitinase n=1 Tax=Lupinus albus TaxID=3870 RepID=A0A6A4NNX0_LUPAL|nr:putative chitinase [Lupinus albus]
MASKMESLILILLFLFTFSNGSITGGIAIYWGQNIDDGILTDTCDSNKYEIVLLSFLVQFGCDRQNKWNFAGHCGDWSPCTKLQPEIQHCQAKGVKVLLSLGGADVSAYDYGLCSPQDAKNVAKYLYDNFLSGQYGPLGSVTLDGIDFDIEKTELYWDDLARELDTYRQNKYFYLSAAPQCPTEPKIYYLEKAIQTGLFDYIFIQFYNNQQCAYSTSIGTSWLLQSWDKWASLVKSNNSIFLGLPAAESAAGSGYIPPEVVNSDVLPHIKETSNYGGVMLWDRFRDKDSDFSGKILPYVPKSNVLLQTVTAVSDTIFN